MGTVPRILIGFSACVLLLPAAALGQKVTYDSYGAKDFSQLKTYAFKAAGPEDSTLVEKGSSTYDDPFVRQRTYDAIAAQLNGRGMTRNDEHPDVYVSTHRTYKEETIYYPYAWDWGYPYGWGWGWGWSGAGWGYAGAYPVEYIRGTLVIDVKDASTGDLLWRGVAKREVHPMSKPSKRTKRVDNEVAKIFKNFPPMGAVATTGHDIPKPR